MKFRKGSKVEVLNKKEVPSGAWHCAEIISGNGHNYSVRYDSYLGMTNKANVDRVSRKAIRPSPLPVKGMESWVTGDVVEVFNDGSWKCAMVLKVTCAVYYLVRLLGSCHEFEVHKSNIRVRQAWIDDKWVVIGQGSITFEDVRVNKLLTSNCHQKMSFQVPQADMKLKLQAGDDFFQKHADFQDSPMVSSKTLKRASPYCSSGLEAYSGNIQKMRAIENGGRQRVITGYSSPLRAKVDAVAYPRLNLGEKYMHASFNDRSTKYCEMERGKPNGVDCFLARSSESNDSDSMSCSVGSCSINNNGPNKFSSCILAHPRQDTDDLCSDAESFYHWGDEGDEEDEEDERDERDEGDEEDERYEGDVRDEEEKCPISLEKELAASIHSLELHAYRRTLAALHASGPLSWEQSTMLTNLRCSLHISNDEHLMELKNLISAGINFCN